MYRAVDVPFYAIFPENILALVTWGEASSESREGQIAVMNVIKNRTEAKRWFVDAQVYEKFGSLYHAVILKNVLVRKRFIYQFSSFNDFDTNRQRLLKCVYAQKYPLLDVAKDVISGKILDNTDEACYYYADYIQQPSWAKNMLVTTKIGRHIFLKEKRGTI